MVLNDADTGEIKAILNGAVLTALRTAAVGGVGVRHLSTRGPQTLGIVGCGAQGFQQARFAAAAAEVTGILVLDSDPEKVPAFLERLSAELPDIQLKQAADVAELLGGSQTVITATTANTPVLPDREDLLRGRHFVGIGSYKPDMREYPEALFRLLNTLYIDTEHAIEETGDLIDPLRHGWLTRDRVRTMGSLLARGDEKEEARQGTTLFKSVGMALFDLGVARLIYEKALAKGLGLKLEL